MPKGYEPWNKGKKMSLELRKKLSDAHIGIQSKNKHPRWGKKLSEEIKIKISNTLKGRKISDEHKEKIKIAMNNPNSYQKSELGRKESSEYSKKRKYKPCSEETRKKISKSSMGRINSLEAR